MSKRDLRYERWLVWLAQALEQQGVFTRLVYDDRHAGDRAALVLWTSQGCAELQIWRLGPGNAVVHVLADTPASAGSLAGWLRQARAGLPRRSTQRRKFADRAGKLAEQLAQGYGPRGIGFPEHVLASLAPLFPNPAPMIGITAILAGKQASPMAIANDPVSPSLWAALIRGEAGPRALLWQAGAQGFWPPREVQYELAKRLMVSQLETLGQWGLVGVSLPILFEGGLDISREPRTGKSNDDDGSGGWCDGWALGDCGLAACEIGACEVPDCDLGGCDLPSCG